MSSRASGIHSNYSMHGSIPGHKIFKAGMEKGAGGGSGVGGMGMKKQQAVVVLDERAYLFCTHPLLHDNLGINLKSC